jgi:hypothetical protein
LKTHEHHGSINKSMKIVENGPRTVTATRKISPGPVQGLEK